MSRLPEFPVAVETATNSSADPWYAEPQQPLPGISDVVLVASGKGGVGKSTVTVNLACAMREKGMRVGILDADLYGPSIARMMDTDCELPQNSDGVTIPAQNYGVHTVSVANVLPPEAALVWKGPLVTQTLLQMFRDIAWPELDVLLVDLPPGTGDIVLSIVEQIPVSGAVVVTTPQQLAVTDAARGIAMFHDMDIPVFGMIENMGKFVCPCCGELQELFPAGAALKLSRKKRVRYLGCVPLEPEGQALADQGLPIVLKNAQGPSGSVFHDVAQQLSQALVRERASREHASDPAVQQEHQAFWERLLDD